MRLDVWAFSNPHTGTAEVYVILLFVSVPKSRGMMKNFITLLAVTTFLLILPCRQAWAQAEDDSLDSLFDDLKPLCIRVSNYQQTLSGSAEYTAVEGLVREICQNVVDRGIGGRTLISVVYGFKGIGLLRLSASPGVVR